MPLAGLGLRVKSLNLGLWLGGIGYGASDFYQCSFGLERLEAYKCVGLGCVALCLEGWV